MPDKPTLRWSGEDDNGARFLIAEFDSLEEAEQRAAQLAQGGHKQHYFIEPVIAEVDESASNSVGCKE